MPKPRTTTDAAGNPVHLTVGAVIERDGMYFMMDRTVPPLGWACPAGHVDEGESAYDALVREVREESGLQVEAATLVCEAMIDWNWCSLPPETASHYWYVYRCDTSGEARRDPKEAHACDWFTPDEITTLSLEPVWQYWLRQLDIISA